MLKNAMWKWIVLVFLVAGSLVVVTPIKEKVQLGLDLQGGTSIVVEIDQAKLVADIIKENEDLPVDERLSEVEITKMKTDSLDDVQSRTVEVIRNRIDSCGIAEPIIYPSQSDRITIQLPGVGEAKSKEAEDSIKRAAYLEFRIVHENNTKLINDLFAKGLAPNGYKSINIGGRPAYVRIAKGDFEELAKEDNFLDDQKRFHAPPGHDMLLEKTTLADGGGTYYTPSFVHRRLELDGKNLDNARVDFDQLGRPQINISFNARGAKEFGNVTSDYAPRGARNLTDSPRQLAIVLDGTLYSAPNINEGIFGGNAVITGSFSFEEARKLANILRAGSLPVPVKIIEKRSVAPSLGQDSIDSGVKSIVIGGIAVLAFMMIYYHVCGFVADIALMLNIIILPLGMIIAAGLLGLFSGNSGGSSGASLPVLTLPGIAGILLTIGMAVDANVLIFERIREELRTGKDLLSSILAGYDRAFITIMDANVTTLLTAIILFIFGSGAIRGFAVTLSAGIIASMFTALVITKLILTLLVDKGIVKKLTMFTIIKPNTSINFVGFKKFAAIFSVSIIVITWAIFLMNGFNAPEKVFGVDFTGGTSITYSVDEEQPVADIRAALETANLQNIHIQYQKDLESPEKQFLLIKASSVVEDSDTKAGDTITQTITEKYPTSRFDLLQEEQVGPEVGSELKLSALKAIIIALIGIIIYITIRFEFGFAMGAIVALLHDVLFTVGIFCLLGQQISLPIIAALLTIVGYSVNDTIVVFDRIREDLRGDKKLSFKEICNLSINQTLSRTLLTSLTTLLAVGSLLILGGGAIFDFALALFIGIIVGTYSSIFVATPVVLAFYKNKKPNLAEKTK
jgi:SecD/SecF fusion protein